MRGVLVTLVLVSACATVSGDRDALGALKRLPLAVHSGVEARALRPTAGQRIEVPPCCVLGEELLTVAWESAERQGRQLHLTGYVHDSTGERFPGVVVIVGRVVAARGDDAHEAEVVRHTRTDTRGRFEVDVDRESRLYLAFLGMMTSEYDVGLVVP